MWTEVHSRRGIVQRGSHNRVRLHQQPDTSDRWSDGPAARDCASVRTRCQIWSAPGSGRVRTRSKLVSDKNKFRCLGSGFHLGRECSAVALIGGRDSVVRVCTWTTNSERHTIDRDIVGVNARRHSTGLAGGTRKHEVWNTSVIFGPQCYTVLSYFLLPQAETFLWRCPRAARHRHVVYMGEIFKRVCN